jgi:5'-3' exonuclease
MGIPSYFAYLLRHHKAIVKQYNGQKVDNLYLDSNSIVYDVVRTIPFPNPDFDARLIQAVCEKIKSYLDLVQPKRVFIAFDGVPPMAKMKQQRERRYKSVMHAEGPAGWNTVQITPGTTFMHQLDSALKTFFEPISKSYVFFRLSTSEEPGEGEHKIFEHVRSTPHMGQTTLVYGLDSDLIILALNHLKYGNIQLLREAPAFKTRGGLHILDVPLLSCEIRKLLGQSKLADYIFLTLFLGNDFMPHFPALNLRTTGFDTLIQTYQATIRASEHLFTDDIQWPNVYKFIAALAARESVDIGREYKSRARIVDQTSVNTPMVLREMEHYINPLDPHWESRYYTALFQSERYPVCQQSSELFLQMLDWNMKYYTNGCPDWDLYYAYMYPPLLVDLAKYKFTPTGTLGKPRTSRELLEFVLPSEYAHLSLEPYAAIEKKPECYWSFCTFLWESHLLFSEGTRHHDAQGTNHVRPRDGFSDKMTVDE